MYEADGRVVATTIDGVNFVAVDGGGLFARRIGDSFRMADGSTGRLAGTLVFLPDEAGLQAPVYRLERGSEA